MADDLEDRGAQDRDRINVGEPHEVRYWTQELDVGADTLHAAVLAVGNSAQAVRQYLQQRLG